MDILGMIANSTGVVQRLFDFSDYGSLMVLVRNALIVGAVLGIVGGMVSTYVIQRDLAFAVHGISELSFAGAAAALLAGVNVVAGSLAGSLVAAVVIGALGVRARDRNSVIGVLMPFGLGLGVAFLALYEGRSANKFGLLVGQVVAVNEPQMIALIVIALVVACALAFIHRPLTFAGVDPELAAARGVPVRMLSVVFMVLLGMIVSVGVQVVGALLVLSIVCTPAAAAQRVTSSPRVAMALSMTFGFVSMVGGMLLAVGASVPISPYVTTISFAIYGVCRLVGRVGSSSAG